MTDLGLFETSLKEVVEAKRLSASRMSKLTEIALKMIENDTQLVSILYRTHKSLPAAAKVSSLYVFDALSRAARHQVTKHGLTGDINSGKGNAATFLLKIEGVLDGLVLDMTTSGTPECKEKTKKILDIWAKGNTFPSAVLAHLKEVVKDAEKECRVDPASTLDHPQPSVQVPTPAQAPGSQITANPVESVQSTLLALLSQAAVLVPNGQIASNTNTSTPQLDAAQLALLQQLTQTAHLAHTLPVHPIPLPLSSVLAQVTPSAGLPQTHPVQQDDLHESARGETSRYETVDRGDPDHYHDRPPRGGYRGGYRGRGRGDGRSRWDDRDRYKERDWSPPPRARRSRSRSPRSPRSPRRYGGRRDIKPYSPPRRPSMAPSAGSEQSRTADSVTLAPEVEKDEFGRDIRPMSPNAADPIPPSIDARDTQPPEAEQSTLPSNQTTTESHDTSESAKAQPPDTHASSSTTSGFGLDTFDVRTFDPTSPSSWEALGTTWQLSCGYLPSQQELMQFVMAKTMAATGVDSQSMIEETWENSAGWPDAHRGAYGGRAWRGRGRGSGGHGHHRGYPGGYGIGHNQEQWGTMNMEHAAGMSDAIVLRGGADNHAIQEGRRQESTGATAKVEAGQAGSHAGIAGAGKMQRVGDKWIFVREPAAGVS